MTRKTKIVATIGPASQDEDILEKLIESGMNVARMNFSHGTHEEHAERIVRIRRVAEKLGRSVGILQDLQGPKIRIGQLDEPIQLTEGETVILYATGTTPPGDGETKIPVDFRQLFASVRTSERLLLDDGRLTLEVLSVKDRNALAAKVLIGGPLSSHKGINLPGVQLRISGFTERTRRTWRLVSRRTWTPSPFPSCARRRMLKRYVTQWNASPTGSVCRC